MFGVLKSLTKAAVGVVTIPIDLVADSVTLGGAVNEKDEPYTASKAKQIMGNIKDACDPDSD